MSDDPVLLTHDEGGVRTLTLNRPHRRNAVDRALWDALGEALTAITDDLGVRAVVLTGADGAFCAGADLSGGVPDEHPLRGMRRVNDVALLLHELPQPTVAAVDGVAVGAGWNLALGCDLVVATPRARFSQIFARRGLSLDFGGSWLLPRIVGLQQAKRIALLADVIGADEARALGLVTDVVAADELDGHVAALA
ncbi:MAG: enoyl-CoA hydratase/isomerase family protein, partial [Actinomycetota bacterium]|nr:enoyl-CoA hydratase/isomerase family protein [Actinomycetota bacterium]